jgi:dCMP deaminase
MVTTFIHRNINPPREDVLSWDDYFMANAFLAAKRSKDPSTQVGACIVNDDKRIVGIGYNGMPNRCKDKSLWINTKQGKLDKKKLYGKKSMQ